MRWLRLLSRAALRGAFVAAALALVARIMQGGGGLAPLPLAQALEGLSLERLGSLMLLGAAAAVALVVVLRPVPAGACRALCGGLVMGAAAVVVMHQSTLFVLHQAFHLVAERGFVFTLLPPLGIPALYALMAAGAVCGAALSLALRLIHVLPDLLTGFLYGALGFTAFAGLPAVPGFEDPWWQWALVNGAWGWGTAFLMRPLDLRSGQEEPEE